MRAMWKRILIKSESGSGMVRLSCTAFVTLLIVSGAANAATIVAIPSAAQVAVGEQLTIELHVNLGVGESASIFQGEFSLSGPGLMSVDPIGYGGTWASTFPNAPTAASASATMSLTSASNRSDHSLLGTLIVDTSAAGLISLLIDPDTFLQRDLAIFPFFEEVTLQNAMGSELTQITVVPEPSAALLIGAGLLYFANRRFSPRAI